MPRELGRVRPALGIREFGLSRSQRHIVQGGEQLGGQLMRSGSAQMGVYRPNPRKPGSLDRHTDCPDTQRSRDSILSLEIVDWPTVRFNRAFQKPWRSGADSTVGPL